MADQEQSSYRLTVRHEGATNTVIVPAKSPATEFERFEDLARKLAQVPKFEIDEKRKQT